MRSSWVLAASHNGLSGSKAGTRSAGLQRGFLCAANAAAGVSSLDFEWAQAQMMCIEVLCYMSGWAIRASAQVAEPECTKQGQLVMALSRV